jgi:SAM-dependent methyltransferase
MTSLDDVYARRFEDKDERAKDRIWVEIGRFLQRYVDPDLPVLDIACDRGYFIRNVKAVEKWASDMRAISGALPPGVHFVQSDGLALAKVLPNGHFGTAFMSNYLEHLSSGDQVIEQLRVAAALLRPGGRVVILQPNIRLTGARYWDFIDHKVALTERSLVEAAETAGFETERVVVRFLPYTTKSRVPQHPLLVRAYLHVPLAWRVLGGQTLYVGRRP